MERRERKALRLKGWDYSSEGWYFITICTKGHVELFGRVCAGAIHESPLRIGRSEYSKFVGYLKAESSKRIHLRFSPDWDIWQRGSYDHIIRNAPDFQRIWNYIDTNPVQWESDCYYRGNN